MEKYYVCQDCTHIGTEFDTYAEARDYLRNMRQNNSVAWCNGFVDVVDDVEAYRAHIKSRDFYSVEACVK